MNICVVSGEVHQNAVVRGKKTKALVFTVITKQGNGNGDGESEGMVSHVPCVMFNAPPELEQVLTSQGKGMHIELQGRVNSSRFEVNGEPRSNAEVVVYTKSVKLGS
jgi:hypothetical protein